MFEKGKAYEYPLTTRAFYNVVCFPFVLGMMVLCVYALIYEAERFFPDGFWLILAMSVSTVLLIGLVFNYYHHGTIIVNEQEIISLKRRGPVSIPWKEIDAIYYKIGGGKQDPRDPFFTVYIFSRKRDFIIVNREIDGISELMDTIRQYANTSRAKYLNFRQLVMLFVRLYLSGQQKLFP